MTSKRIRQLTRLEQAAAEHMRQTAMAYAAAGQLQLEEARQARIEALTEGSARRAERAALLADAWEIETDMTSPSVASYVVEPQARESRSGESSDSLTTPAAESSAEIVAD